MALCLSQVGVLLKRLNECGWFLACELLSTYPTLCFKEIQVPSKIRVLPSGTLLQTLNLEKHCATQQCSIVELLQKAETVVVCIDPDPSCMSSVQMTSTL